MPSRPANPAMESTANPDYATSSDSAPIGLQGPVQWAARHSEARIP
jgi:hypothetical protein